jgi:hypothetical protein
MVHVASSISIGSRRQQSYGESCCIDGTLQAAVLAPADKMETRLREVLANRFGDGEYMRSLASPWL